MRDQEIYSKSKENPLVNTYTKCTYHDICKFAYALLYNLKNILIFETK